MTEKAISCQILKTFLLGSAIMSVLILPIGTQAIGQITKPILVDDALRGQEFEESMSIFNSEDQEVTFDLLAEGGIDGWVTFFNTEDHGRKDPVTEVTAEANGRKGAFAVFNIPEDTPNGEYVGYLSILRKADKEKASTTTATLQQKISRRVTINVSDKEIVDFNSNIITQDFGVTIGEPIHLKVVYENNGNIAIKPQVKIKTKQIDKVYTNVIHPYPDELDAVKPRSTQELPIIEIPTDGVEEGKLGVVVEILYKDEVVHDKNFLVGVATEAVESQDNGNAHPSTIGKDKLLYLFGLLIIIIASITFVFKMKRK